MAIRRGPFDIKWGDNTITSVEEIDVEYTNNSEDFDTIDGRIFTLYGSQQGRVTLTLLSADIPALAALLPQYFVPNGGILSTGQTVNHADGAIDITPRACDEDMLYNDLDIISCANPGIVYRVVNARTVYMGDDFGSVIGKSMVQFIGEPAADEATIQLFREGTVNVVS